MDFMRVDRIEMPACASCDQTWKSVHSQVSNTRRARIVKVIWILVLVGHIALLLAMTVVYVVNLRDLDYLLGDLGGIALFVGIWVLYLVAILGSRVKGDTLLSLTIEVRKAELRKRLRKLDEAE